MKRAQGPGSQTGHPGCSNRFKDSLVHQRIFINHIYIGQLATISLSTGSFSRSMSGSSSRSGWDADSPSSRRASWSCILCVFLLGAALSNKQQCYGQSGNLHWEGEAYARSKGLNSHGLISSCIDLYWSVRIYMDLYWLLWISTYLSGSAWIYVNLHSFILVLIYRHQFMFFRDWIRLYLIHVKFNGSIGAPI